MLLGDRGVSTHTPFAFGVAATIIEPINVKGFLKRQKRTTKSNCLHCCCSLTIQIFLCICALIVQRWLQSEAHEKGD